MRAHASPTLPSPSPPLPFAEECRLRNEARARGVEHFRAAVLPKLFPHVRENWRFVGYSTRELRIEPRHLIDHPRLFAHGRKRNDFVLVSMPYCEVPESGTAIGYDHWERSPRAKVTLQFQRLPSWMSWHYPGSTKIILLWPENSAARPDFRGLAERGGRVAA